MIFRLLTVKETKEFRKYATENDPPSIEVGTYGLYHPECRKVWEDRGIAPCGTCGASGQQVTANQHALGFDHEYTPTVTVDMLVLDDPEAMV